jgi:hypothetical protein
MEFDFKVVYKPGEEHIVANFLSRMDKSGVTLEGCDHNETSQHDYFAKGSWPFF